MVDVGCYRQADKRKFYFKWVCARHRCETAVVSFLTAAPTTPTPFGWTDPVQSFRDTLRKTICALPSLPRRIACWVIQGQGVCATMDPSTCSQQHYYCNTKTIHQFQYHTPVAKWSGSRLTRDASACFTRASAVRVDVVNINMDLRQAIIGPHTTTFAFTLSAAHACRRSCSMSGALTFFFDFLFVSN